MAKKSGIEEEENVNVIDAAQSAEEVETGADETPVKKILSKVKIAPEVEITNAKKVKVRFSEDARCSVACTIYDFQKDRVYEVPSDVAAILCHAKKAYRV